MKFYILKHPTKGYITNKGKRPNFTENVEKSYKYNRKCDASNSKLMSTSKDRNECDVVTLDVLLYVTDDQPEKLDILNRYKNVEINPEYYGKIEISNTINRIK